MPAAANLTIADSVPGNHTFVPFQKDGMKVYWAEKTTPHTPAGFYVYSMEYNVASSLGAVNRWDITLDVPIEALNSAGVYEVVGHNRAIIKLYVYKGSTALQVADIAAYVKNFLGNATIVAAIAASEGFY